MRKYGMVVGGGVTVAAALAAWLLLYPQFVSGGKSAGQPVPRVLFGPVPCQPVPPDIVPLTPLERLGKDILYDCFLSDPPATLAGPPGYACATCHMPQTGYTSPLTNGSTINLLAGVPPGNVPGRSDNRRAMSYAYAVFSPEGPYFDADFAMAYVGGNFWDGRAADTTAQARMPFLAANEMNNTPTNGIYPPLTGGYSALVSKKATTKYRAEFEAAYGPGIIEATTPAEQYILVTAAEAAFEGSAEVCQFSSKYDASPFGVPPGTGYTLTASEERGRVLYFGNAICSTCHSSAMFPAVTDQTNGKDTFSMYCFANIGVPKNAGNPFYQQTDCTSNPHGCNPQGRNYVDYGLGANPNPGLDGTRFMISTPGDVPQFRGLFQTATTRNVDLRPFPTFVKAYMHNGVFKSLKTVVHFYNKRNIAVSPSGTEVAFDLRTGPPPGFTRLFPPPEVLDNVQNVAGMLGCIGNLGLTNQDENDLVAFLQILSDGFTPPNPVGGNSFALKAKAISKKLAKPKSGSK
jgi:cytochrome c peroxidase